MAGVTLNNWITIFEDGDRPGAGSTTTDSTGVNGIFWKIVEKMSFLFNLPLTTLRSSIIDGAQLKPTVADASSIEQDSSTKKLKIKAVGVQKDHVHGNVADGVTIQKNGSGQLEVVDDSLVADKLTHDNTRTKDSFTFSFDSTTLGAYAKSNGLSLTALVGIPMPYDGCLTRVEYVYSSGAGSGYDVAYAASASDYRFSQGDRISPKIVARSTYNGIEIRNIDTAKDYVAGFEPTMDVTGVSAVVIVISVEYDN